MLFTPLQNLLEDPARLFFLLLPIMSLTPLILDTLPLPINILPTPLVIRISLRPRHSHLDELARHIHPYKVMILVELEELFPEDLGGFSCYRNCTKAPVGKKVGFVGFVGQDSLFASPNVVGHQM